MLNFIFDPIVELNEKMNSMLETELNRRKSFAKQIRSVSRTNEANGIGVWAFGHGTCNMHIHYDNRMNVKMPKICSELHV